MESTFLSLLTGANKQYVDAFMSGVQEPWVFQGGVQAEIQVCNLVPRQE